MNLYLISVLLYSSEYWKSSHRWRRNLKQEKYGSTEGCSTEFKSSAQPCEWWILLHPSNPFSTHETLIASCYYISVNYILWFHQLRPSQLAPTKPCILDQFILIPFKFHWQGANFTQPRTVAMWNGVPSINHYPTYPNNIQLLFLLYTCFQHP